MNRHLTTIFIATAVEMEFVYEIRGIVMVNNERVALMTQLAIYETNYRQENEMLQHYRKQDYVQFHSIRTFLCSSAAFFLMLLMLCVTMRDQATDLLNGADLKTICIAAGMVYTVFVWVNIRISSLIMNRKYERARGRNHRYMEQVMRLEQMYETDQLASYVAEKEKEMELNEPVISD